MAWLIFRKTLTVALVALAAIAGVRVATAQQAKDAGGEATNSHKEAATDDAKTDLDNMQGTWTVVAAEREGQASPAEVTKTMQLIIKADSFKITVGQHDEKGTLKLDPSAKPKSFELIPSGEHEKAANGIYDLTAGTLKMCWTKEGGERSQRNLLTKPGSNMAMFILKRDKKIGIGEEKRALLCRRLEWLDARHPRHRWTAEATVPLVSTRKIKGDILLLLKSRMSPFIIKQFNRSNVDGQWAALSDT